MKSEAEFKKHFKASVRAQGGFSISLAAPMLAGVPDLWCCIPGYVPVLLEAKWMKEITINTNKQIPITPIQKHFLDNCNKVHPGIAWCLIGYKFDSHYWAVLLNTNDRIEVGRGTAAPIAKHSELFDIKRMFELYVPKMNLTYGPKCATVSVDTQIGDLGANATLAI